MSSTSLLAGETEVVALHTSTERERERGKKAEMEVREGEKGGGEAALVEGGQERATDGRRSSSSLSSDFFPTALLRVGVGAR